MQIMPSTTNTMGSYTLPLHPIPINNKLVAKIVAIVIPEMGLLDEPINPTMREATVTKKAPKIITSRPIKALLKIVLPGIIGNTAINTIKAMLPTKTILILRSLSVLLTAFLSSTLSTELMLLLKEEMIVGIVFNNVINPPAVTAPAPIALMYARYKAVPVSAN